MLKIYGTPISVHTRKVIAVLLHKNVPFENVPVVPVLPGNPPANWRELSPTGKIPVLDHDGFVLEDSSAICAWLDRRHSQHPVYPDDANDYARVLAYEQYAVHLYREVVHPLFVENVVNPNIRQLPKDERRIARVLADAVPECFGYLDSRLNGSWLVGKEPTMADFAVTSNLMNFRYLGYDLEATRYPHLAGHFMRSLRETAMSAAWEYEAPAAAAMGLDRSWHVQDR